MVYKGLIGEGEGARSYQKANEAKSYLWREKVFCLGNENRLSRTAQIVPHSDCFTTFKQDFRWQLHFFLLKDSCHGAKVTENKIGIFFKL